MKALPVVLFVVAASFAVFEYEHGRLHRAVAANDHARIENLQRAPEAGPPHPVEAIKPDLVGIGAKASHYVGPAAAAPAPPPPPRDTGSANSATEVDAAKQGARADNQVLQDADQRMFYMRVAITAVILPLCLFIIFSKVRYKSGDKNFAYVTVGAVVAFWLHS